MPYERIEIPETKICGIMQAHQPKYSLKISPNLTRNSDGNIWTDVNRMEAGKILKERGCRFMRANEWRTLTSRGCTDPSFNDNFGRNPEKQVVYEWLEEVLTRPKGRKEKYAKTKNGREFNLYTVFVDGKPTIDLWLPEGGVVEAWHSVGLPSETRDSHDHGKGSRIRYFSDDGSYNLCPYRIHYFPDYGLNQIALYVGMFPQLEHGACFRLSAYFKPSKSHDNISFREVRGSVPEHKISSIEIVSSD